MMNFKNNDTLQTPKMGLLGTWLCDVEALGDEAYKRWHTYGIRDYPVNIYADFSNNAEVFDTVNNGFDDVAERKQLSGYNVKVTDQMTGCAYSGRQHCET